MKADQTLARIYDALILIVTVSALLYPLAMGALPIR
jgi:hypothetical protein